MATRREDGADRRRLKVPGSATFAAKLRLAMEVRSLNQTDLATRSGTSQTAVSGILLGDRSLYVAHAVAIARALDVPIGWLVDDAIPAEWPPSAIDPPPTTHELRIVAAVREAGLSVGMAIGAIIDAGARSIDPVAAPDGVGDPAGWTGVGPGVGRVGHAKPDRKRADKAGRPPRK